MRRVIEIGGMGCMKCVDLVKEVLGDYEGISDIISVEVGKAVVVINEKFDEKKAAQLLTDEEFDLISIHGE
ncbi:MAG: heavy-metal-associated domain-containing protein [Fusobacteriaceae bacterium]